MAAIGTVIDGKYEILKLVGKGGMSRVYLAMDKRLNKQWAVKEIEKKSRDKNNAIVVQSAIAEANMIKSLDHPSLPRIVDIIDNGNVIYVIMDFIEGVSLNKVLDMEGAQSQEQVIEWAKELCDVLDYLHTRKSPIIYRDMKPGNVMLKPDGSLKLIDFGIARKYKEENIEDTVSLGTKGYAAPEQFGGKGQTDARTDIYCLGVTLYHLVTGKNPCEPPYEIYPIRHWNPALSSGFEHIIQKCTQLNPQDRYQSCAELMYALEHYEEEDEAYKAEQKSKLKKFVGVASAAVSCIIVACICLIMNASDVTKQYNDYIKKASNTDILYEVETEANTQNNSIPDAKVNYYLAAIDLKPDLLENNENNPYFAIVDLCEDYNTNEMASKAMQALTNKEDNVKDLKQFGQLAYNIGDYYLYFSSAEEAKQIAASKKWFDYATDDKYKEESYYTGAVAMSQLLDSYTKTQKWSKKPDSNEVKKYASDFKKLINSANNISDSFAKYDYYRLTLMLLSDNTLEKYFATSGVAQDDVLALVSLVKSATDSMGLDADKQKTISSAVEFAQSSITDVYLSNSGVE